MEKLDVVEIGMVTLSFIGMLLAAILFIRSTMWFELVVFSLTFITLLLLVFIIPEVIRKIKDKNGNK